VGHFGQCRRRNRARADIIISINPVSARGSYAQVIGRFFDFWDKWRYISREAFLHLQHSKQKENEMTIPDCFFIMQEPDGNVIEIADA
jgi:hypothetical protein